MSDEQDEGQILHPDCSLEVGGEVITVREFNFGETLQLGPLLAELIGDMDAALGDGGNLEGVLDTLYRHPKALEQMLVLSTGKDADWVNGLKSADGERLVMAFWGANGPFFARRVAARRTAARVGQRLATST